MASHDGKRRSHQRFLRNLPKQKPGKYLKVILSSVADPDLALRKGGRGRFSSFCDSFFFFYPIWKGEVDWVPRASSPRSATALARVGLIAAYLLFWAGLFEKGLTLILV